MVVSKGELIKRQSTTDVCTTPAVYKSPAAGAVVDSSQSITFQWATDCKTPITSVDIYLYAPDLVPSKIQVWYDVKFSAGSYTTQLQPAWWKSAPQVTLQYALVQSNTPSFMATIPPGPVFAATYNASGSGDGAGSLLGSTTTSSQGYQVVDNLHSGGLSRGKLAAAVLMPILVVAACLTAYILWSRAKVAKKRKRWSQAVDRRMSVISTDWRSITAAGAAVRSSVATNRMSTISGRPVSVLDSGRAGAGAGPRTVGSRMPTSGSVDRISRVSFAADSMLSRPSMGDGLRPGAATRAYHRSSSAEEVPPLPYPKPPRRDDGLGMSPEQARGPAPLSTDEIRARVAGQGNGMLKSRSSDEPEGRPSFDAELTMDALALPAITLMRTGGTANELLLAPQPPSPPAHTAIHAQATAQPSSPTSGMQSPVGHMPLMKPLAPGMDMSPDQMLRVYAERRGVSSPTIGVYGHAYPMPPTTVPGSIYPDVAPTFPPVAHMTPSSTGGSVRTLYAPPMYNHPGAAVGQAGRPVMGTNNPFRNSAAPSESSLYSPTEGHDIGTAE